MKFFFVCIITLVMGCTKTVEIKSDNYLMRIEAQLKDSLSLDLFRSAEFSRSVRTIVEDRLLLRVPLRGTSLAEKFILVETKENGDIIKGRIIEMKGKNVDHYRLNSTYISNKRNPISKEAARELEEVVIICTYPAETGISWSYWFNLSAMLENSSYSSWYTEALGGGGGGSYSPTQESSFVEYDNDQNAKQATLEKLLKCFDNIPSSGATFEIKLNVDIPLNSDPYASSFGDQKSAVGHVFLTLTKTNGTQQINQVFGFYPTNTPSILNPSSPVSSMIVNNSDREVNARLGMSLTEAQFNQIRTSATSLSSQSYSLTDYNCTNFALQVFNSVRTNPITVGGYAASFPNLNNPTYPNIQTIKQSPQMLFIALQNLKNSGSSEAPNVLIDQSHNTKSVTSKGECD